MENASAGTQPIKVVIIEDERDIRDGLGMLVGFTEGFESSARQKNIFHLSNLLCKYIVQKASARIILLI